MDEIRQCTVMGGNRWTLHKGSYNILIWIYGLGYSTPENWSPLFAWNVNQAITFSFLLYFFINSAAHYIVLSLLISAMTVIVRALWNNFREKNETQAIYKPLQ